ncbi:DotU/TssL family secretion system protein [Massilia sp. Dwa41.01b]|uniref:DotU/TssL family secretion system protein n=1 Tax=Massilia sp. Dwa41.01b TaxID=2709302 RepID=UPI0035A5C75D
MPGEHPRERPRWLQDGNPLGGLFRDAVDAFYALLAAQPRIGPGAVSLEVAHEAARRMQDALGDIRLGMARQSWSRQYSGEEQLEALQYAFALVVDETLLNEPWPGRAAWGEYLLEWRLFKTRSGGERLLERIDAVLHGQDRGQRDIAEVYLHCLSLGFAGRLRDRPDGPAELARRRTELFAYLYPDAVPLDAPGFVLTEAPDEHLVRATPRTRGLSSRMRTYLLSAAVLAVPLVASLIVWLALRPIAGDVLRQIGGARMNANAVIVLVLVLVLLLVLGVFAWLWWRRRRAAGTGQPPAAVLPLQASVFARALRTLHPKGADYRYEKACVLVCGGATSGKTDLLRAAGMEAVPASEGIASGWWRSPEGVAFELPSNAWEANSGPWTDFLRLIERHRSVRALDAIVLAVPFAQVASDAVDGERIYRKLVELQDRLGLALPVYVVVTGCEDAPGFAEWAALLPPGPVARRSAGRTRIRQPCHGGAKSARKRWQRWWRGCGAWPAPWRRGATRASMARRSS